MIEIVGAQEGSEFDAAMHLRRMMLNLWPDLARHRQDRVKIFVGMHVYGHKTEEIDLFVVASFSSPRSFAVEYQFYPRDAEPFVPKSASVRNLALVIEVKTHDARGVRFTGTSASVRYSKGGHEAWHSATEQNRAQMFVVGKRLEAVGVHGIWLQDLILFMGLKEGDLPARPHNCLGSDASFERILNVLGQVSHPSRRDRHAFIGFGSDASFEELLSPRSPLFRELEPTPLDRRKMDVIAKGGLESDWMNDLGQRQILFRGRGGVGKTVLLLQMAYRAYDSESARSLILTFNRALVSDMRRTMALLGVPRSLENGGVLIDTIHALIGRLLAHFSIGGGDEPFGKDYYQNKQTLLDYLRSGAISRDDLTAMRGIRPAEFDFDYVFVDEAQDCPSDEIEIFRAVYGATSLVVADGVDQVVRGSVANWAAGLTATSRRTHKLTRCLRMKANLARFVADVAIELDIRDWDLEPNIEAAGGRVILVEGNLAGDSVLYPRLRREALDLGNYPIDMLGCVPPSMVGYSSKTSIPGDAISSAGGRVWDGCNQDVRESFPTDRDSLRIVQYDSCRGLEGWTVIAYAIDEFWDYKRSQLISQLTSHPDDGTSADEEASAGASRWTMIPLTRAIDTLVLNVTDKNRRLTQALIAVADRRPDFVERHIV